MSTASTWPSSTSRTLDFGPMGARGLGELPLTGAAAAVANAVFNATGIRLRDLPMLPEKIRVGKLELKTAAELKRW